MCALYLGRIVAVALTPNGNPAALYRVSSRSFPNRRAVLSGDGATVSIMPRPGHESDLARNPYIAYNCLRLAGGCAVVANGSHADPAAGKIAAGMPVRDALILTLLAMDYERDGHSTPRIIAVADAGAGTGWLGTVRRDGLDVQAVSLSRGSIAHLATYGHVVPSAAGISPFSAETPEDACAFVMNRGEFANFANPVSAVAAVWTGEGFRLSVLDA